MTKEEIASVLKDARIRAGLSQAEVGRRLGWKGTGQHVSKIERGLHTPRTDLFFRWLTACKVGHLEVSL